MLFLMLSFISGTISQILVKEELFDFMAITVATEENKMLQRFEISASDQNLQFTVRKGAEIPKNMNS